MPPEGRETPLSFAGGTAVYHGERYGSIDAQDRPTGPGSRFTLSADHHLIGAGDADRSSSHPVRHSGDCRRRVVDRELHCVAAAPAVAAQMAGDMDRSAARLGEELTERCARDPEGDRP